MLLAPPTHTNVVHSFKIVYFWGNLKVFCVQVCILHYIGYNTLDVDYTTTTNKLKKRRKIREIVSGVIHTICIWQVYVFRMYDEETTRLYEWCGYHFIKIKNFTGAPRRIHFQSFK